MKKKKSSIKYIMKEVLIFFIFIVIVGIFNILGYFVSEPSLISIVGILNKSIIWLFLALVLFYFGKVFRRLSFPYNLPWPLIDGVAWVFLIKLMFDAISVAEIFIGSKVKLDSVYFVIFENVNVIVSSIVFLLVIIIGYIVLISNINKGDKKV